MCTEKLGPISRPWGKIFMEIKQIWIKCFGKCIDMVIGRILFIWFDMKVNVCFVVKSLLTEA